MPTVPETIYSYLCKNAPPRVCDDCIREELKLANRQQVHQVTATLAVTPLFERFHDMCMLCGRGKLVIEQKP